VEAEPGDDDYADKRYYAFNWSLEGDDGMYDEVNKVLRLIDRKVVEEVLGKYTGDDVEQVKNAKSLVLETSLDVLKKLEAAGLFGKRTKKRFVSLQIADSENEIMQRSARELNAKSVFEECKSVFPYFDPDSFEDE
jgi:hypothetical protein